MKFVGFLFFVGLICAASAKLPMADRRPRNTINQHFIDFLHNERENFPCGWPDSGIGPIEPYYIDEFEVIMESNSEFSALNFLMTNADVTGQKHMWINDFDLAIAGLIIQFDISIPSLQIAGDHQTSGSLAGIVSVPISGQGRVNMNVHNVHVRGIGQLVTIGGFLHLNHLVSTVVVESVDATLTGFGLLDGTVSQLVSSLSPGIVNDNQDRINNAVYAVLVPGLNNFLNNHTLTTLINLMADRNQNPPPRRCFW